MDRRRFVVSAVGLSLSVGTAGCFGDDDDEDDEDDEEPASSEYRHIRVESVDLQQRADALVRQMGEVFVTLRVENTGTDPTHAEITLQLLNADENNLGSPYKQRHGPIAPGEIISVRFDVEQQPSEVAGYELVIAENTTS